MPPGRNRIVSSMVIEKKIVSYALPRNGSESRDRKHGSHDRTPKVAASPNVVIHQDVGGHQEVKLGGKEKADEVRVEGAGHPSEEAPDGKRQELIGSDVHPERQREIIRHANALPDEPQTALLQLVEDEQGDHHEAEREVALARSSS